MGAAIANRAIALTMTTGSQSDTSGEAVVFLSPYLADQGSGGGLVGRMNLACLREVAPRTVAFALSNAPSTASYTCIGAPRGTLATALCNLVGLAGRLTPAGLLRSIRLILQRRPAVVFLDSSSLGWVALLCRIAVAAGPRHRLLLQHRVRFPTGQESTGRACATGSVRSPNTSTSDSPS